MQRTNSEYGSPYLATHHFPLPFPSMCVFSADPRLLGALRKTVSPAGGGGGDVLRNG